jgi:phosphoglycolate phosphatase
MKHMKQVDLMVFDLDGTLIQSGEDMAASVHYTLKSLGFLPIEPALIEGFIGDGLQVLVRKALGANVGEYFDRAMPIFYDHYSEHLLDHTTLYPGAMSVLEHFKDKTKVILTNKQQQYTTKITKRLGLDSHFMEIIGEGSASYKKPDPRLLKHVTSKYGMAPERTVVIGDGINDILLARGAGVISCAFLGGLTKRDKLISLSPDLTCETLSDLKMLLC